MAPQKPVTTAASNRPSRAARIAATNKIHKTEIKPPRVKRPPKPTRRRLRIRYKALPEDLIPTNTGQTCVLIHSCNTRGSWRGSVGRDLKQTFPDAFDIYRSACEEQDFAEPLLGTCLLIEPQPHHPSQWHLQPRPYQYIACLFVSERGGSAHDPADQILVNTRKAVKDLMRQLHARQFEFRLHGHGQSWAELRMPRINSRIFGIPWQQTESQLDGMLLSDWVPYEGLGMDCDTYIEICEP